jgi:hypothetical protein
MNALVAVFCTCCPWEYGVPVTLGLFFAVLNRCPKCKGPTDALPVAGDRRQQLAGPDGTP